MNNSVRRQAGGGQVAVDSDYMRSDTQALSSEMIDADVSAGASYYNDEIKQITMLKGVDGIRRVSHDNPIDEKSAKVHSKRRRSTLPKKTSDGSSPLRLSDKLGVLVAEQEEGGDDMGLQVSPRQTKVTPFNKPNFKDANYRSGDNFVDMKKKKGMALELPKKTKYNEDDRSNNAPSIGKRSIEVDDVEAAEKPKNKYLDASNDSQQRSTSVLEVFEFKRDSSVKELQKL